jgi:ribosome modulation factor
MDDIFAEGMEAFACGLRIKDCPYPRYSTRGKEWVKGYYQAMNDPLCQGESHGVDQAAASASSSPVGAC